MKKKKYADLAQLVEHLAYIQRVGSSNLSVCTLVVSTIPL